MLLTADFVADQDVAGLTPATDATKLGGKQGGGAEDVKAMLGAPGEKKSGNLGDNDGPILHVDLIKGRNLIKSDLIGKSDPYAVLKYGDQQDKTKVVKNSLNPQWDHGSDFDMDLGDNTPLM